VLFFLRIQQIGVAVPAIKADRSRWKVAKPQSSESLKEMVTCSAWEAEAGSKRFKHLFHGIARV